MMKVGRSMTCRSEALGACSPRNLPELVWVDCGKIALDLIVAHTRWNPVVHYGAGIRVRNSIRMHATGWTDIELDELWAEVAAAAHRTLYERLERQEARK